MGSAGWRHKGDKGIVMEPRQLHSSPDEEYQKKNFFFKPRNVPKCYLSHGCRLLHLCSTLNLLLE